MPPSQEKLADLGALTSGLVHELRNPLNAIKANLQLMEEDMVRDEGEDGPHGRRVRRLLSEVDRLDKILSDFLAFVRGGELRRRSVDLSNLLQDVVTLITPQADSQKTTVLSDLSESVTAEVDVEALKQAVMNLCMNGLQAIQDAGAPGGTLIVRLSRGQRGSEPAAVIEVTDTGRGIPREDLERIYDLFFTTRKGGTGIGLAVVSRIVSSHGGEIRCESEPGRGTSFRIRLPALTEA